MSRNITHIDELHSDANAVLVDRAVDIDKPIFSNIDRQFRSIDKIGTPPSPPPFLRSPWPNLTSVQKS